MKEKILQPSQILEQIGVKPTEEAIKALRAGLSFLNYLLIGDSIQTSLGKYTKISEDLIHVETELSGRPIVDSLEENNIFRLPV